MNDSTESPVFEKSRLAHFPITLYAALMGMTGFTIAYQKAVHFFHLPASGFFFLLGVVSFFFLSVTAAYVLKAWRYPDMVSVEFDHPVKINFFAAFPIVLLLLGIAFYAAFPPVGIVLWYAGTAIMAVVTLYVLRMWVHKHFDLTAINPAWFIPIVGNLLIPVAGVEFLPKEVSLYFFSIGIFFWILLSSIVLQRLIVNPLLPSKFIPMLFIFIAPPAVAFISYIRLAASFDVFAGILLSLGLFFGLMIFFMWKSFLKGGFSVSRWAFTFPLAALSISFQLAYALTGSVIYAVIGLAVLAIAGIAVVIVLVQTIHHMIKREICVED
jgi:tellurite resistance protein